MFAGWVAAALSHPTILLRAIDDRVSALQLGNAVVAFDGEEAFLRERRTLVAQAAAVDQRARRLTEWLRSVNDVKKAVVFVDDAGVADGVAEVLRGALGANAVVRHDGSLDSVRRFENQPSKTVLVCDRTAEEGLNLQRYGAAMIHFDLPLEPARLEQRIGRIDRLEARGQMRNVAFTVRCPYESDWLTCVQKAIRVFDRSVAPLQTFWWNRHSPSFSLVR